ncbi:MAG: substrate-binding domain-containing protein [Prolixibacteraceae bacterium]
MMNNDHYQPIYKRLITYYRNRIQQQEYLPGDKIDSISRIMSRHSVSRDTAKLVLQKLNKEGWVMTITGRGTFVAPQTSINKAWAVIIPFYSSNMEHLLNCLNQEARQRNRAFSYFLHYNNYQEETRLVSTLIHDGYESVIIVPNYDESLTADFYSKLVPGLSNLILVDNTMAGSSFKYVIQSYELGIKRALEYLQQNGPCHILFVKNEIWKGKNLLNEYIENSLFAYAAKSHDTITIITTGNASEVDKAFCEAHHIGGIICYNDINAATIVGKLLHQNVQIPDQISIVNYGNTELTKYFTPAITVVDCKYEALANQVGEIIDKGRNSSIYEQHVIQPELIIRET